MMDVPFWSHRFGDIDGCPELKDGVGEDLLGADVSSKIVGVF